MELLKENSHDLSEVSAERDRHMATLDIWSLARKRQELEND